MVPDVVVGSEETVCQEQLPSPSSLKYLVPPDSPVDNTAVPSGVEDTVSQLKFFEPSVFKNCPVLPSATGKTNGTAALPVVEAGPLKDTEPPPESAVNFKSLSSDIYL